LKFDKRAFGTLSFFFIVLMIPVLATFATSRAILMFNASRQWFLLGPDSAKALVLGHREEFVREQCTQPKLGDVAKTKFSQSDAASICKFWLEPKTTAYTEKTVHEQRVAGGWLLLVFGVFSFRCWRGSGQANAALKVHNKLSASDKQEDSASPESEG
jgi:hypothetical protein